MAPAAPISIGIGTMRGGKALRDKLPLEQHGEWKEFEGRTTPIGILRKFDAGRMKELVPIRYGRMLQSPFAFYRGAAGVMASDLSRTPHTGLTVHACGDCHLMNFGGFATPERNIIFDINDFDETSPAPWEWDVKRLVASIVLEVQFDVIVMALEAVYEQDFRSCSYGFRPGRSAHQALRELYGAITKQGQYWVLDVDIRKYLDDASYYTPACAV
jgi:hypothetical protein